jgi:hypothetical protein
VQAAKAIGEDKDYANGKNDQTDDPVARMFT